MYGKPVWSASEGRPAAERQMYPVTDVVRYVSVIIIIIIIIIIA